jgi:hypothetical protein
LEGSKTFPPEWTGEIASPDTGSGRCVCHPPKRHSPAPWSWTGGPWKREVQYKTAPRPVTPHSALQRPIVVPVPPPVARMARAGCQGSNIQIPQSQSITSPVFNARPQPQARHHIPIPPLLHISPSPFRFESLLLR